MKLRRYRNRDGSVEVVVEGVNARMRALLKADIVPARVLHVRLKPSVEMVFNSTDPPDVFVPGCGQTIPQRVIRWLDEGEGRA